jgi:hypothetical protein
VFEAFFSQKELILHANLALAVLLRAMVTATATAMFYWVLFFSGVFLHKIEDNSLLVHQLQASSLPKPRI